LFFSPISMILPRQSSAFSIVIRCLCVAIGSNLIDSWVLWRKTSRSSCTIYWVKLVFDRSLGSLLGAAKTSIWFAIVDTRYARVLSVVSLASVLALVCLFSESLSFIIFILLNKIRSIYSSTINTNL